ncbi:zinc-finger domain-containing protein [Aureibacillus halotolerans]|uniref:Uncharacterized protein DUF2602 n=1 Tax=Aureibacillus halotolerans TaxID=1508390 RepID=A0A4V3D5U3_9BACI|nr:zinc-finger domain-containing protein [Aureibacillus halotolerans]TDQ41467.1 uncharacterized protein DUF2602 [Aureibacillus halotolerans]
MKQKSAIVEVGKLLDEYCEGCFLKTHNKKRMGKRSAHQFCIQNCTVGQQLKALGSILENEDKQPTKNSVDDQ